MYKIMLCCSAGMSTSLLVRKMVEAANERDLPVQIDAYGVPNLTCSFRSIRWCCLAPVKYMLKTLSDKAASLNILCSAHRYDGLRCAAGRQRLNYALSLIPAAEGVEMSSLYQSMIAVIEQSITPLAGRLGQQKYVIAIRDGFTAALPFMIIGSSCWYLSFRRFHRYHQRLCPRLA